MAKTKLTRQRQEIILKTIREGASNRAAAAQAGVPESTLYDWLVRGQGDEEPFRTFRSAFEKAKADREAKFVGLIQQAAEDGTWQAAAWYLERTDPEHYGRKERHQLEHSGRGGGPQVIRIITGSRTATQADEHEAGDEKTGEE